MSASITHKLAAWFGEGIDKHAPGGDISWDFVMIPSPDGRTAHILTLITASPLLGQFIQTSAVFGAAHTLTKEQAEEGIVSCIKNLETGKSNALAEVAPPELLQ